MVIGNADAALEAGNLGPGPLDRKSYGCGADNTKVIAVVGVLPHVLAIHHEILPDGLLHTGVEFIAKACSNGSSYARNAGRRHDGGQDGYTAACAGDDEIFVKGSF